MKTSLYLFVSLAFFGFSASGHADEAKTKTATFAGGCFWCVEADFDKVKGVKKTISGFAGGHVVDPSYKQVVSGSTGHYEAVQVTYDPEKVSYETLLDVFWHSVDPTDPGGQFCDRGQSYATAVFVHDETQRAAAQASKETVQEELTAPIVTPILQAGAFYPAEKYHQNYYRSQDRILSRFGYITKAEAYKGYRRGCGRDARVKEVWGETAFRGIK